MSKDLVSIIIPVYNAEKYIKKCIDSILNQSYDNLEIVIINDGSDDGTLEVCENFNDERIHIYSQQNKGVANARNNGLRKANGEWMLYVDADDWIEIDLIEKLMENVTSETDIVLYHTYKVIGDRKKIMKSFPDERREITAIKDTFFSKGYAWGMLWGKLFRKSLILDNDIQFDERLLVGEDRAFMADVVSCCKNVQYLDYIGYYYQMNDNSISRKYLANRQDAYIYLCKKMKIYKEKMLVSCSDADYRRWLVGILLKIVMNGVFHPNNPKSYSEKKKELRSLINNDIFKEAVEMIQCNSYKGASGIFLFCIKYKLYVGVSLISWIRIKQIKTKG